MQILVCQSNQLSSARPIPMNPNTKGIPFGLAKAGDCQSKQHDQSKRIQTGRVKPFALAKNWCFGVSFSSPGKVYLSYVFLAFPGRRTVVLSDLIFPSPSPAVEEEAAAGTASWRKTTQVNDEAHGCGGRTRCPDAFSLSEGVAAALPLNIGSVQLGKGIIFAKRQLQPDVLF